MELKDALIKSRFFCAQQERSAFEVRKKLMAWGLGEIYFDEIISYLQENNFLSEQRFTELFVKSKINQKKWGRLKIRNELMKHHVEGWRIDDEMNNANPDTINKNLIILAERKLRELEGKEDKNHDKLKRFLYSKGYEPELIIEYLNNHII